MEQWLPKSVLCLRHYTLQDFLADLPAGITVGLVALPLAMAFAIASGLSPQSGIYCAVVTGFLISALGGSQGANRRPDWRVRRRCRRHCRQARGRWPVHVHHDGRRAAVRHGSNRTGRGREVHSASRSAGLHQWHRDPDRQHAGQGLLRAPHRERAGRFLRPHDKPLSTTSRRFPGKRPLLGVLSIVVILATSRLVAANSGIHRRPGAGHDRGGDC